MTGAVSLSASVAASPATDQRQQLAHAAKQFEAIFLRQMLATARSTDFGGNDLFGSSGEDTFTEMRDAHFADLASETGAFGMAAAIEAQLTRLTGPGK